MEVWAGLISRVTEEVETERKLGQNRALEAVYPIVVLEAWVVNVRHEGRMITTCFTFPADIRRAIYTTNAIKSMTMTLRKGPKNHRPFPTDEAALKVIYRAIDTMAKKWTMPIRDWKMALNRFAIEFEGRFPK